MKQLDILNDRSMRGLADLSEDCLNEDLSPVPPEKAFSPSVVGSITMSEDSAKIAPATVLGANLEMLSWAVAGMLSDRLDNPKFCGPANEQTGLALGWEPHGPNMGEVHNQLVRGMFLSGDECQMVNCYAKPGGGIIQTGRRVGANEELEVEIWAKVRHHPVTIEVALRPLASHAPEYSKAEVVINAAYWKCYKMRLHSTCEDSEAAFFVIFKTKGVVLFDQIHLRPIKEPHVSTNTVEAIGRLNLSTLRFPGGCVSTNYHWKLGTGPEYLRPSLPDPVFKKRAEYGFGTDEYLAMCHAQGIKPYITVNIGSGDPKEAGEWARYCAAWFTSRALELPEIYFQMGNEHYGVWESAHMTAPMYLEALKEFVPAVRENYPKSVIIGLGEPLCSGAAGEPDTELRKLVLLEARELLDVIAINRYKGQWYDNPRDQMLNVAESVLKIEKNLLEVIEDCRSAGFPPRVALPEWNYWLHASHWDGKQFFEPDDVQHGLFVSGMFHMMARLAPEMEVAAYETAVNCMGLIRNEGTHVVETSVSGLFRLYRPAFPGRVVSLKISTPDLENGCPQLDVLALRQDKKLWVFASNRSLLKAITVDLNGTPKAPVEARLFAAHDYQAPLLEVSPLMKDEAWVLPPLSLMRLCYHVES